MAMPTRTYRFRTPANWAAPTQPVITGLGSYTMAAPGATVDLTLSVGEAIAIGQSGYVLESLVCTTAARPLPTDSDWPFKHLPNMTPPENAGFDPYPVVQHNAAEFARVRIFDTTLGAYVVYDGVYGNWRNPATGARGV